MNIKKIITVTVSTVLLTGMLASCTPDQTPAPPSRTDGGTTAPVDPTDPTETTPAPTDPVDTPSENPPIEESDYSRNLVIPGGIPQKDLDEFAIEANFDTLGMSIINLMSGFSSYPQFQGEPFDPAAPISDLFLRDSGVLFNQEADNKFRESLSSDISQVFSLFPHFPANGVLPGTSESLDIARDQSWTIEYANPRYVGVNTSLLITGMNFSVDVRTTVPLADGRQAQVLQTLNLTMLPTGEQWIVGDFSTSETALQIN